MTDGKSLYERCESCGEIARVRLIRLGEYECDCECHADGSMG